MISKALPATGGREGRGVHREGRGRRKDAWGSLLYKPIEEEEPGAKHPINLTSFAAQISEDIRREFNMWGLGRKSD